jgi:hypothetical protein
LRPVRSSNLGRKETRRPEIRRRVGMIERCQLSRRQVDYLATFVYLPLTTLRIALEPAPSRF